MTPHQLHGLQRSRLSAQIRVALYLDPDRTEARHMLHLLQQIGQPTHKLSEPVLPTVPGLSHPRCR